MSGPGFKDGSTGAAKVFGFVGEIDLVTSFVFFISFSGDVAKILEFMDCTSTGCFIDFKFFG